MKSVTRSQWSWAFYDWANSAFATTIMAGFFPVFFKQYWAADLSATDSTFWLGVGNSVAAAIVVMMAPFLGVLCDRVGMKKRLLLVFASLGVVMSGGLFMVEQGHWLFALVLYGLALMGFSAGNVAYDSMLPGAAPRSRFEQISAMGYSLGYLGGGLVLAINVWMVTDPALFGLADAGEAVRVSFMMVAIWWALFSVPVLLWVDDQVPESSAAQQRSAWGELVDTWKELRTLPMAFTFLLAYWLYIDAVDTVARMAVDYGLALGFASNDLLAALLITQVVGFPAALAFGYIGARMGAKRGIWLALMVYILVVFWIWRVEAAWEFYVAAFAIGLVHGGIQALSRALYARMIPVQHAGRFFGLYNMMGKFAAVIGPVLVGWVAVLFDSPRAGMLSVLVLFAASAVLLVRVDVRKGEQQAQAAGGAG